jgi:hypothetical protein
MSDALTRAVRAMADPPPGIGTTGVYLPENLRQEAQAAVMRYDQLRKPAPVNVMTDWLWGLNALMKAPLYRDDFKGRAAALMEVLRDLPASVFISQTRNDAAIAFEWFPGAGELVKFLAVHAAPIITKHHALQRLLITREPGNTVPLTQEEREAVLEDFHRKMEAVRAERLTVEEKPVPTLKLAHATRDQLRAIYSQRANDENPMVAAGARIRLAMLASDPWS